MQLSSEKLTVKKVPCGVPYLLCLSDFHIKYMQVGTEKMLLFFYLAALCIQMGLWLKLGFLSPHASAPAGQITASVYTCLFSVLVQV